MINREGIVWFKKKDWTEIKQKSEIFSEISFEFWEKDAQKIYDKHHEDGCFVEKVLINAHDFFLFCREKNLSINTEALEKFLKRQLKLEYEKNGGIF